MKKEFKMENLDCAHCAALMESKIAKLDGVNSVSISFIMQKIVIDAEDKVFEYIIKKAAKICKKIEPDCILVIK